MHLHLLAAFILSPQNSDLFLRISIVFSILIFSGVTIFLKLFSSRNLMIILGGSMILGPLGFLLILSILSYVFKGDRAIALMFAGYFICNILLFANTKNKFAKVQLSFKGIILFLILLIYSIFIMLYSFNVVVGGDVITYWGIATSFAHGNYPTVLPWQPEYLTVYHEGIFILEGAINSIAKGYISQIHFLFSGYIISSIFIFVTGIAWEKTKSLLSILPSVMGIICFSGPVMLIENVGYFLKQFGGKSLHVILSKLSLFPQFGDIKYGFGGGATSISDLVYVNFRSFGLAAFFLFLYILLNNKTNYRKYIILAIITILTVSIDETFFLIELPFLILNFIWYVRKFDFRQIVILSYTLFLTIFSLFWLIQNPVRDSILTPSPDAPRFKLLSFHEPEFGSRIHYMDSSFATIEKSNHTTWFLPDLRWLLVIFFLLAFWKRSRWAIFLLSASVISIVFYLFIVNTFWYANAVRIILNAYELAFFALGFVIISIIVDRKRRLISGILILLLFLLLMPQIITANARFFYYITLKSYDNITQAAGSNETLDWIYTNLPQQSRLLFLENNFPSRTLSTIAVMQYGLIVPTADPNIKVLNIDSNGTWFDAGLSLDPTSLKSLNIQYIFIQNGAINRLTNSRKSQLNNIKFFKPIYRDFQGVLYKINPAFFAQKDFDITLKKISDFIPNKSSVYLDVFPISEIRKYFILSLTKRTRMYGYVYSIGADYPMYIETASVLPHFIGVYNTQQMQSHQYDYIITVPEKDPSNISAGSYKNIISTNYIVLWQRIK